MMIGNWKMTIKSFVIHCIRRQQSKFGIRTDIALLFWRRQKLRISCSNLNAEMKFFDKIVPLPHPRFIMQYKLKKKDEYIESIFGNSEKLIADGH